VGQLGPCQRITHGILMSSLPTLLQEDAHSAPMLLPFGSTYSSALTGRP